MRKLYYRKIFENSKNFRLKKDTEFSFDIFYKNSKVGNSQIYLLSRYKKSLELAYLMIDRPFRSKGIGSKYMKELCKFATENEFTITLLPYRISDTPLGILHKFYEKFGFEFNEDGEMIRY